MYEFMRMCVCVIESYECVRQDVKGDALESKVSFRKVTEQTKSIGEIFVLA